MGLDLNNWMMVFVRASGFLIVLPIFSTPNVPPQIRIALGALLATLITPLLPPWSYAPPSLAAWFVLFAREAIAGLILGFVTRMVFYVTDFAGRIIANEMGLSVAQLLNPLSGDQMQAPGLILFYFAAIMMLSLDMHHWLLIGFQQTYDLMPIGQQHLREALLTNIVDHTRRIFVVGVQMAAPLMATSFIIMIIFAFLGRAVPQMSAFSESFGIRILAGLAVFGLTMEIMAQHILNYLHRLPEDMMRVAQYLGAS